MQNIGVAFPFRVTRDMLQIVSDLYAEVDENIEEYRESHAPENYKRGDYPMEAVVKPDMVS